MTAGAIVKDCRCPICGVRGEVAVTGQTAFWEATLVALFGLGLDVMISWNRDRRNWNWAECGTSNSGV